MISAFVYVVKNHEMLSKMYEQNKEVNGKLLMDCVETLIVLLSPLAPHFAEELWESLGKTTSVHKEAWPKFNEAEMQLKQIEIPVQINDGLLDRIKKSLEKETLAQIENIKKNNSDITIGLE